MRKAYHSIQFNNFKKAFFNGRTDKKDLLNNIKHLYEDFESLMKFTNRIQRELINVNSLFKRILMGENYLPKSYSELGRGKYRHYTRSLNKEMNWQALAFLNCSDIVNKFIQLKDQFEQNMLVGKYEEARVMLDKIEKDICVSLWSIEYRFILDEYQFGTERNWETRNIILSQSNDAVVRLLASMYSVKAEQKFSFFQYNDYFEEWELNQSQSIYGLSTEFQNYIRLKGNYFSFSNYNNLTEILFFESSLSIIDRYLLFIRVCQHYASKLLTDDHNFIFLLKHLSSEIRDVSMEQILAATDDSFIYSDTYANVQVLDIIDEYSKGNYLKSKCLAKKYLATQNKNVIDLCNIYAKSLVELNEGYENITEKDSFLNKISKVYFDISSKGDATDEALVDLVKFSYVFNNSHIGTQLYAFLIEDLGWKTKIDHLFIASLSSKFINPKLLTSLYQKPALSKNFIYNITRVYPKSATIDLFTNFYENYESNQVGSFLNSNPIKNKIYQIRSLMLLDRYDECIKYYSELLSKNNLSVISKYEIVSNLFLCYLNKDNFRDCIMLYVSTYLQNNHLTKKMNVDIVMNNIIKDKFKSVGDKKSFIELPIFFEIISEDRIKIKQAYDSFLRANNCRASSGFQE